MEKETFLQLIKDYSEITLVGPMPFSEAIERDEPIIYVDGGLNHRIDDSHPHLSLGDNDSNITDQKLDILLERDKDFSDLSYALDLIPFNIEIVTLLGFIGGRKDHEFLNFGAIYNFLEKRDEPCLVFIDDEFIAHSPGDFILEHHGLFSLITFDDQEITLEGDCKYKLESPTLIRKLSSRPLSNQASGSIHIQSQKPLFIYLQDS
ncbi:hypothetical protein HBN50_04595 [Halobacteriovorax sp. GB3]|uniref:hypothetical protein n=1 Tax=Halobacteriovorax sp. GB3 TaxID=2719615 RepID=UPI00235DF721|nr:hypothetical protein [Halobacteriovorax sp. GB3]MDD0852362.1 hypothetical protein [Halobacteriovorax sp. GB3]